MTSNVKESPISAKTIQAIAKPIMEVLMVVVPFGITTVRKLYHVFQKLPQNARKLTLGGRLNTKVGAVKVELVSYHVFEIFFQFCL